MWESGGGEAMSCNQGGATQVGLRGNKGGAMGGRQISIRCSDCEHSVWPLLRRFWQLAEVGKCILLIA